MSQDIQDAIDNLLSVLWKHNKKLNSVAIDGKVIKVKQI